MNAAEKLWKKRFAPIVVDSIEEKVKVAGRYPGAFENRRLASL
jgi:hypothetical protein